MNTTVTDMAAFVLPMGGVTMAAASSAAARRQAPAVALAPSHGTDLSTGWSGETFGTTGVTTKRPATAYVPQSRGSTG